MVALFPVAAPLASASSDRFPLLCPSGGPASAQDINTDCLQFCPGVRLRGFDV